MDQGIQPKKSSQLTRQIGVSILQFITGDITRNTVDFNRVKDHISQNVKVHGFIHKIRRMSGFAFIILRSGRELLQAVYSDEYSKFDIDNLSEGSTVILEGLVVEDQRSPIKCEIQAHNIEILSVPSEGMPIVVNAKKLNVTLDTNLQYRPLSLRNPAERAIFKIQEGIVRGFREFLLKRDFTEVHTPKIVYAGAEGGSNIFTLDYFGKTVFLAQSPQFYKQMMVGVFERVFEIGPVFRAEKHSTSRHLNEYISLDLEMGFVQSFTDIMEVETKMLRYLFNLLESEYKQELELLKITLPQINRIPVMKFMDAKELISKTYNREITDYDDFEPEEERLLCEIVKTKHESEFVFVTHYPTSKRPFYAKDDPTDPNVTLSFDLLFRGLEITTGGQRIHDYHEQLKKAEQKGLNPEDLQHYLMIHKYGMPPHGGLAIGLERLTSLILGLSNVRSANLFPRDIYRVTP